jgi:hypothetical protein
MALVLVVLAIIPIASVLLNIPFVLPLTIGSITRDFYNEIEDLPEGSIIAWNSAAQYSGYVGIRDGYRALFKHIFESELRVIFTSFAPDTPIIWQEALAYSRVIADYNLVEGEDFVVFPFLAGEESAMAAAAANFKTAWATDLRGVPSTNIPLLQEVEDLGDCQLCIHDGSSFTQVDMYVRQWPAAYNIRGLNQQVYATSAPYYGRFIFGCLDGTRGYAEYEVLTGFVGEEVIKMDARNLQGLFVLVMVFFGNAAYLATRQTITTKER